MKKKNNTIIIVVAVAAGAVLIYMLMKGKQDQTNGLNMASPYQGLVEAIGNASQQIFGGVSQTMDQANINKLRKQQQAYDQQNYQRSTSGLYSKDILF